MYNEGAQELRYKSSIALWYMARFDLPAPGFVHSVNIKLDGTGEGKMRIFGHEGGSPYAELEKDLIDPITFSKSEKGIEFVEVELPEKLWLDNNQFFVAIDVTGSDLSPMRSGQQIPATCTSSNGGTYVPTILAVPGNHAYYEHLWSTINFPMIVDVEMEYPSKTSGAYLKDVTEEKGLPTDMSTKSVAWGDYNQDGILDLLVAGRLFQNQMGKDFLEITGPTGLNGAARANCFIDMNNDGLDDIIIFHTKNHLYINNGDGSFTATELSIPEFPSISSFSIGDVNDDGFPDLFIGQLWGKYPVPGTNYLFLNNQNNDFDDGTKRIYPDYDGTTNYPANTECDPDNSATWLSGNNRARRSRGSQFVDFDEDGDLDLYVVNYFLESDEFYENNGDGTFTDIIAAKKIDRQNTGSNHGTGVDWADYDNDGDMDLLLSQFSHPWGQIKFDHRGTTVYRNSGAPNFDFTDVGQESGIQFEETHAGSAWGDVNNDGLVDFITTTYYGCRYIELYSQNSEGNFDLGTYLYGLENTVTGEDAVWVDYDNDGRLDLCVGEGGKFRLYKNTSPIYHRRFIEFDLVAKDENKKAIGAKVKVTTNDGSTYYQQVVSGRGQRMMKPLRLHFGLNEAAKIEKVSVTWPSGEKAEYTDINLNRIYTLKEDGSKSLNLVEKTSHENNVSVYPNPSSGVFQVESTTPLTRIELYSIDMKLQKSYEIQADKETIDISGFEPGMYLLRVYGTNFNTFEELILKE